MAMTAEEYNSVDAFLQEYLAQVQHEQGATAAATAAAAAAAAAAPPQHAMGGGPVAAGPPQAAPAPAALLHQPDGSHCAGLSAGQAQADAAQAWPAGEPSWGAMQQQQHMVLQQQALAGSQFTPEQQQMLLQQQQMYAYSMLQQQQQHAYAMQQQHLQGSPAFPGALAPAGGGDAAMQDVQRQGNNSSTSKRTSSRSKRSSATGGGGSAHNHHLAAAAGAPPIAHIASAPPGQAPALGAAENAARPHSYSAGCVPAGNLASLVHTLQQQQQLEQQQQRPLQAAAAAGAGEDGGEQHGEPDMSHLTVMQRYHARRKLALQRMEREVEAKLAQLALLEDENKQLRWRAHILENMLRDMDKQLELMAASEDQPDAAQWLTLLGMGGGPGGSGIARTLHRMLEGAGRCDVAGWSAADCRRRWLAYLTDVRPLVEEAEAAQAEHRARCAAADGESEEASGCMHRRPRRAAAAAADAVIKQEAAEVLGLPPRLQPLRTASSIPEPPAPPPAAAAAVVPGSSSDSLSARPSGAADGADAQQQQQHQDDAMQVQRGDSSTTDSVSQGAAGSEGSCSPSVEGVPAPLLGRIEALVLAAFHWLLAIMTTNPLLTYEFIAADLLEGKAPLPPGDAPHWSDALDRVRPTLEQMQEACTSLQVARACMAKVMEERAALQAAMQADSSGGGDAPESSAAPDAWLSGSLIGFNARDALVERMRANVRKESVVRNLVGFYCINVFSSLQLAQVSLACSPWFPMAWRVTDACEARLNATLAASAERAASRSGGGSGHNTRSSARLAAQQQRAS